MKAEEKAIEAGYLQSDKEQFTTTPWAEHNIFIRGYGQGYKDGAIAFAKWIIKNNYNSTLDNKWVNYVRSSEHYTTEQLFELFAQEGGRNGQV